jgi:hypothetical protein
LFLTIMFSLRSSTIALSLTALAYAQSLSKDCTAALTNIATDSAASNCLNPGALLNIVTSPDDSIINPIDNWLTGLCSAGPCSDDTLSAVLKNVSQGCSTELNTMSVSLDDNAQNQIKQVYPTAREVICTKDTDANKFCVTKTLNNLQDIFGTLSVNGIVKLAGSDDFKVPTNISCSSCAKAAYTIVKKQYPAAIDDLDTSACSSDFTDGNTPSNIQLTASDSSQGANGGASALSGSGFTALAISGFVALLSVFTTFV